MPCVSAAARRMACFSFPNALPTARLWAGSRRLQRQHAQAALWACTHWQQCQVWRLTGHDAGSWHTCQPATRVACTRAQQPSINGARRLSVGFLGMSACQACTSEDCVQRCQSVTQCDVHDSVPKRSRRCNCKAAGGRCVRLPAVWDARNAALRTHQHPASAPLCTASMHRRLTSRSKQPRSGGSA